MQEVATADRIHMPVRRSDESTALALRVAGNADAPAAITPALPAPAAHQGQSAEQRLTAVLAALDIQADALPPGQQRACRFLIDALRGVTTQNMWQFCCSLVGATMSTASHASAEDVSAVVRTLLGSGFSGMAAMPGCPAQDAHAQLTAGPARPTSMRDHEAKQDHQKSSAPRRSKSRGRVTRAVDGALSCGNVLTEGHADEGNARGHPGKAAAAVHGEVAGGVQLASADADCAADVPEASAAINDPPGTAPTEQHGSVSEGRGIREATCVPREAADDPTAAYSVRDVPVPLKRTKRGKGTAGQPSLPPKPSKIQETESASEIESERGDAAFSPIVLRGCSKGRDSKVKKTALHAVSAEPGLSNGQGAEADGKGNTQASIPAIQHNRDMGDPTCSKRNTQRKDVAGRCTSDSTRGKKKKSQGTIATECGREAAAASEEPSGYSKGHSEKVNKRARRESEARDAVPPKTGRKKKQRRESAEEQMPEASDLPVALSGLGARNVRPAACGSFISPCGIP